MGSLEEQVTENVTNGPDEFFDAIDSICLECEHTEDTCNDCPIQTICTVFTDASFLLKLNLGDIIILSTDEGIKPYMIVYDCTSGYSIISNLTGVTVVSSIFDKHTLIAELVAIGDIVSVVTQQQFCSFLGNITDIPISMDNINPQLIFD